MKELVGNERMKILPILNNRQQELSVITVLSNTSPGKVFVDNDIPQSFLVKTPECNLIGGKADNLSFNNSIKDHINYYDSIVCDCEEWEKEIKTIHPNCALNEYTRKYYKHFQEAQIHNTYELARIEYVNYSNLKELNYKNKELVLDWINILNVDEIPDITLAAIVVMDDIIVSCSAVDCITENSAEIGIKTISQQRGKGYGAFAVSGLINKLIECGIKDIGWHCMITNIGSQKIARKCGFVEQFEYQAYYPFPPIENASDLSEKEWNNLGSFFMEKGVYALDQYWQAARCFAQANNKNELLICINILLKNNQTWFLNYMDECEEFIKYREDATWNKVLDKARGKIT